MSYLPTEISLSRSGTNKFAVIKQRTGITPNLVGRAALMLALESGVKPEELKELESYGQKIPKDIFFGDDLAIYDLAVELYIKENKFEGDSKELINRLVDHGAHSIPSVKSILDLEAIV